MNAILCHHIRQHNIEVLPYMVLCNVYKQNIVELESFMLENVIIYRKIEIEKFAEKIRSVYNYIMCNIELCIIVSR